MTMIPAVHPVYAVLSFDEDGRRGIEFMRVHAWKIGAGVSGAEALAMVVQSGVGGSGLMSVERLDGLLGLAEGERPWSKPGEWWAAAGLGEYVERETSWEGMTLTQIRRS